jgi:hypothetical protein
MAKFKVGDKVRVICTDHHFSDKCPLFGEVGKIIDFKEGDLFRGRNISILLDGYDRVFSAKDLELVAPPIELWVVEEYNVGLNASQFIGVFSTEEKAKNFITENIKFRNGLQKRNPLPYLINESDFDISKLILDDPSDRAHTW